MIAPAVEAIETAATQSSLVSCDRFPTEPAERREWNDFVAASGGDIYFLVEWMESWWAHYGAGRRLRCFVARRNGEIVAALPFFTEDLNLGPLKIRIAKLVGADFGVPVLIPAAVDVALADVLPLILSDLLEHQACDAVSFSPLSESSGVAETCRRLARVDERWHLAVDEQSGCHITFELPTSFAEYLGQLPKKARSNLNRPMRNLEKDHKIETRDVQGAEAITLFPAFADLHHEQWSAEGRLGHFGDWPNSLAFHRQLLERLNRIVHLHVLSVDGQPVAMQYGYEFESRFYWLLPARKLGERWKKHGIGAIALARMIASLIERGVSHIEAGRGHYDYKLKLGGLERQVHRIVFTRNDPAARARIGLLKRASDAIHLVYYRVWFLKLAERLRIRRLPLAAFWIRTRL